MVGLEALPLPAREAVVRLLPPADALRALPFVSEGTLAALKELKLPIGTMMTDTVEAAVRQANALRRAYDLGALKFNSQAVTDVSALAGCASLHTLDLSWCCGLTNLSGLAGCAKLRSLNCYECNVRSPRG